MIEDPQIDARLYAMIHRGTAGDLSFYRRVCRGARSVLELGSGTGRVQTDLANAGLEITGLDVDRDHLEYARSRAAALPAEVRSRLGFVHADMRSFDLGRVFDRVIAPYHVLFALLDDDDTRSCLASVRAHLAPGGRFAADAYLAPDLLTGPGDVDPRFGPLRPLVTVQEGRTTVRVYERQRRGRARGRIDVEYTFHMHEPGRGVVVRRQRVRHRVVPPEDLVDAIAHAGLTVVEGPDERELGDGARGFTIVAGAASAG